MLLSISFVCCSGGVVYGGSLLTVVGVVWLGVGTLIKEFIVWD
jgi:hypothetical protein